MNPSQPLYFSSITIQHSARTSLELDGDNKIVFIDHPIHGQHHFLLPTKEEISIEYSYGEESSKKKWINSFMIFRIYLQKSKNWVGLSEVSKIASDAWNYATKDVLDACNELESVLKGSFKFQRFVPYSKPNSKKQKKITSKKKQTEPPVYPSPPKTPLKLVTPTTLYTYTQSSLMCSPTSQTSPVYKTGVQMSSLTLPQDVFNNCVSMESNETPTTLTYTQSSLMCSSASSQTSPAYKTGVQMPPLTLPPAVLDNDFVSMGSNEIQELILMLSANSSQNQLPSASTSPLTPSHLLTPLHPLTNFPGNELTSSTPYPLIDSNSFGILPIDLEQQIMETATGSEVASMEMQHPLVSSIISPEYEEKYFNYEGQFYDT